MSCWPAPPSTRGRPPGRRVRRAGTGPVRRGRRPRRRPHLPGAVRGAPRRLLSLLGGPGPVVPRPPGQRPGPRRAARALAAAHPYSLASAGAAGLPPPVPGRAVRDAAVGGAGPGDRDRARLPDPGRPGGHPRRLGPGRDRMRHGVTSSGPGGRVPGHRTNSTTLYLRLLGEAMAAPSAGRRKGWPSSTGRCELVGPRGRYYCPSSTASVATCWAGTAAHRPGRRGLRPGHGDRRRVRDQVAPELRAAIRLCRLPDGSTPAGGARPPCGGLRPVRRGARHPRPAGRPGPARAASSDRRPPVLPGPGDGAGRPDRVSPGSVAGAVGRRRRP